MKILSYGLQTVFVSIPHSEILILNSAPTAGGELRRKANGIFTGCFSLGNKHSPC